MTAHRYDPIARPDPDTAWRQAAACRGSDHAVFYPHDIHGVNQAKAICAVCPVQAEFLEYALGAHETHGVFGGTSEKQRQIMWRRRNLKGAA